MSTSCLITSVNHTQSRTAKLSLRQWMLVPNVLMDLIILEIKTPVLNQQRLKNVSNMIMIVTDVSNVKKIIIFLIKALADRTQMEFTNACLTPMRPLVLHVI